ncbi:lys-63-specific deubiquitinase BRCC36-like [Dysidea avara]|uniref:lys-63-specific deubiquitinase BRCC36-like n=1 Tax=Dysidea avara TaxID=196820 RepID=UPI003331FA44
MAAGLLKVHLSADAYLACLTHVLSAEKEEVMGVLLGELQEEIKTVLVRGVSVMRRIDKRADRVEISPEQLTAIVIDTERLSNKSGYPLRVVGWYHSHPHITVFPSHIDIKTQANYQLMDDNFVGLIFSCFNEEPQDKKCKLQVIAFQSLQTNPSPPEYERLELPLSIVQTPLSHISSLCMEALVQIPVVLFQEEEEAYTNTNPNENQDVVTQMYNSSVYTQSLTQMLDILCGPLLGLFQEAVARNKQMTEELTREKNQLLKDLVEQENNDVII